MHLADWAVRRSLDVIEPFGRTGLSGEETQPVLQKTSQACRMIIAEAASRPHRALVRRDGPGVDGRMSGNPVALPLHGIDIESCRLSDVHTVCRQPPWNEARETIDVVQCFPKARSARRTTRRECVTDDDQTISQIIRGLMQDDRSNNR